MSLRVPAAELPELEAQALAGSVQAAEVVMSHCLDMVSAGRACYDELWYWTTIAAENGSCSAQSSATGGLGSPDPLAHQRAGYWLRRSKDCYAQRERASDDRGTCGNEGTSGCHEQGARLFRGGMHTAPAAASAWEAACTAGTAQSCFALAFLRSKGLGVPRDEAAGLALFQRACDLGDLRACRRAAPEKLLGDSCAAGDDLACDLLMALARYSPPVERVHRDRGSCVDQTATGAKP